MLESSTVSAFEAKTNLSKLINKVQKGFYITITKHDKPVAMLVPISPEKRNTKAVIEDIFKISKGQTLGELDHQQLKQEGRR
jgi:prevent-host-death family protein